MHVRTCLSITRGDYTVGVVYAIIAFIISIALILIIAKKSITLGILIASIFLGIVTIPPELLLGYIVDVFSDAEYLMLATAVGLIPIIGGLLDSSGLLTEMIENFKFSRKSFLIFSPAVIGLLPMPGGALFSAPMVDEATDQITPIRKASINQWYRHVFHLIYPLAPALIIGSELAGINIYIAIMYIFPAFLISFILGLFLLLRNVKNGRKNASVNWNKFFKPLLVILLAPFIDITLKNVFNMRYLATLIGVSASLILLIVFSKVDLKTLLHTSKKAKPWDFFFLILGIFLYQTIFVNSGVPHILEEVEFSPYVLLIVAGFSLGVLTGRLSTPIVILIPIFTVKFGLMTPLMFAMLYHASMMGYIISPVHPCLVFTAQYFKEDTKNVIKDLTITDITSLLVGILLLFLLMPVAT